MENSWEGDVKQSGWSLGVLGRNVKAEKHGRAQTTWKGLEFQAQFRPKGAMGKLLNGGVVWLGLSLGKIMR